MFQNSRSRKVKTLAFDQSRVMDLLKAINRPNLRAYGTLLYWLACRAGEPLPYIHYEHHYQKDFEGKAVLNEKGLPVLENKELKYKSFGIDVDSITLTPKYIQFKKIPIFKTRQLDYKEGLIPQANNPLFDDLCEFINERKKFKDALREQGNQRTVYLFEAKDEADMETYYWRLSKALIKELKSMEPTFKIHSLRVSRATQAGDASGDPFYVQSITGHASIEQASQYTKSRNFKDKFEKYEGTSND